MTHRGPSAAGEAHPAEGGALMGGVVGGEMVHHLEVVGELEGRQEQPRSQQDACLRERAAAPAVEVEQGHERQGEEQQPLGVAAGRRGPEQQAGEDGAREGRPLPPGEQRQHPPGRGAEGDGVAVGAVGEQQHRRAGGEGDHPQQRGERARDLADEEEQPGERQRHGRRADPVGHPRPPRRPADLDPQRHQGRKPKRVLGVVAAVGGRDPHLAHEGVGIRGREAGRKVSGEQLAAHQVGVLIGPRMRRHPERMGGDDENRDRRRGDRGEGEPDARALLSGGRGEGWHEVGAYRSASPPAQDPSSPWPSSPSLPPVRREKREKEQGRKRRARTKHGRGRSARPLQTGPPQCRDAPRGSPQGVSTERMANGIAPAENTPSAKPDLAYTTQPFRCNPFSMSHPDPPAPSLPGGRLRSAAGLLLLLLVMLPVQLRRASLEGSWWVDENESVLLASGSTARLLDYTASDTNPPGYFLALTPWMALGHRLFGAPGVWWPRLPSVAVWTLLAGFLWFAGRRLCGPVPGAVLAWRS